MSYIDKINVEGNISRINSDISSDKYIWFDICKNSKYKDKEGLEKTNTSFFSAKIDKSIIEEVSELFKVGAWVVAYGIPKSYIDRQNKKSFYIHVLELKDARTVLFDNKDSDKEHHAGPVITYDPDGVMVWDGKRCESEPATEEEQREMEELLKGFE